MIICIAFFKKIYKNIELVITIVMMFYLHILMFLDYLLILEDFPYILLILIDYFSK